MRDFGSVTHITQYLISMAKKKAKKVAKKKAVKSVKHEIVVRVAPQEILPIPSTQELAEPMRDGKKLTIPKTWLSSPQLVKILQQTPKNHVYKRKGRGGQVFDYVTGSYITKALNFVFGWNWDFEVMEHGVQGDQIWVKGRLTVRGTKEGEQIVKTQFGRADIKFKKDTKVMLDFGNDLKAATTDAMKKCASLLGIASDIYGKTEYKQETEREPADLPVAQNIVTSKPKSEETHYAPADGEYHCVGVNGKGCAYGTASISKAEHDFSMKVFKKPLCRDCQKEAKK